jgi:hypothetical protein
MQCSRRQAKWTQQGVDLSEASPAQYSERTFVPIANPPDQVQNRRIKRDQRGIFVESHERAIDIEKNGPALTTARQWRGLKIDRHLHVSAPD